VIVSWLRVPLVHFLAGGAVLFALVHGPGVVGARSDAEPPARSIELTQADVEHLRAEYARETGLAPSALDERVLVQRAVDEELLFREAIARGLDRSDRSVRNWLVEQMTVLSPHSADDPDQLYRRALELGLDRTDLVVRRILVQKMRLVAARLGERPPTDEELEAFYARHAEEYRMPARVSFRHVFLAKDRHGADLDEAAASLLASLRRNGVSPDEAERLGDPFAMAPVVSGRSEAQVATMFGAEFAAAVRRVPVGEWAEPIASPYGRHLVWVSERDDGAVPALASVRGRVTQRWLQEERERRVASLLDELHARYEIRVASAAWRDRRPS